MLNLLRTHAPQRSIILEAGNVPVKAASARHAGAGGCRWRQARERRSGKQWDADSFVGTRSPPLSVRAGSEVSRHSHSANEARSSGAVPITTPAITVAYHDVAAAIAVRVITLAYPHRHVIHRKTRGHLGTDVALRRSRERKRERGGWPGVGDRVMPILPCCVLAVLQQVEMRLRRDKPCRIEALSNRSASLHIHHQFLCRL